MIHAFHGPRSIHPDQRPQISQVNTSYRNSIFSRLVPITEEHQDAQGRVLTIWKFADFGFFGSVKHLDATITFVSADKIINPLNPTCSHEALHSIAQTGKKKWELVFLESQSTMTIWPKMIAAMKPFVIVADRNKTTSHITQNPGNAGHIFRKAAGHFSVDNRQNRQALQELCSDPKNLVGKSTIVDHRSGRTTNVNIYAKTLLNGTQLWGEKLDNGRICNGGRNFGPKFWVPNSSLHKGGYYINPHKMLTYQPKDPGNKDFQQKLQQTKLTDSYNSTHSQNPVPAKGGTGGVIGGVACSTDFIKGLFDSPESLFEDKHYFCIPTLTDGLKPFSDAELSQILRELAIGVYVHSTIPFFSLHFNQRGDQFPVIHPVYENTLVGRVIGILDYFMKGYLNGGVYQESFIDQWHQDPNWKKKSGTAFEQLIDFEKYCQEKLQGQDSNYFSLGQAQQILDPQMGILGQLEKRLEDKLEKLTEKLGLADKQPEALKSFEGFKNSFRIIAKQKSIQKSGEVFFIDSDFDVLFTIEPTPEYTELLDQFQRKHGQLPPAYQNIKASYELFCERIHDHMVKMPLCRNYFAMLGMINFISGYFSTLKKYRKFPVLPEVKMDSVKGCPPLFPHLPVKKMRKDAVRVNPYQIQKNFAKKPELKSFLTSRLRLIVMRRQFLDNSKVPDLKKILLNEFENNMMGLSARPLQRHLKSIREKWQPLLIQLSSLQLEGIINQFDATMRKLVQKCSYNEEINEEGAIQHIINHLKDAFQDKDTVLMDCTYGTALIHSEISPEDFEKGKRILGGCGMKMERLQVHSSPQAQMARAQVEQMNHSKEIGEFWQPLSFSESQKGFVFGLSFQAVPYWIEGNYEWMESLLLLPTGENSNSIEQQCKIIESIETGDKAGFLQLIAQTPNIGKMQDRYQRTLLHHAAKVEDPFFVNSLLEKKLSVSSSDVHGYLPLHYAAMSGSLSVLKSLLAKNKQLLNTQSHQGTSPLDTAIQHEKRENVQFLLSQGASFTTQSSGFTSLHTALHQANIPIIYDLLKSKETVKSINESSDEGGTPLMLACELDDPKLLQTIIQKGGNPDTKRKDGITAIEIALLRKCKANLEILLQHSKPSPHAIETAAKGSSIEILQLLITFSNLYAYRNAFNDTVVHVAIRNGNIPGALFLIKQCSDIELLRIENKNDETAFSLSCSLGIWEIVEELVKKTVVRRTDIEKCLPSIIYSSYDPIVKKLLNDLILEDSKWQKALLLAAQVGNYLFISQVLLEKGVPLHKVKGPKGWKIQHYLAKCDGISLFKTILSKTEDFLNPLAEEDRKTLPYIAAENKSSRILSFLLKEMKKRKIPLTNHFQDRNLFYGVVDSGHIENVQMMLDIFKESSLYDETLDSKKTRAVHIAAKIGSKAILELLVKNGANLHVEDAQGRTPLFYAIQVDSVGVIKYILENKKQDSITSEELYLASASSNEMVLPLVIPLISPRNLQMGLLFAIIKHDLQAFNRLVACGASFDYEYPDKKTSFEYACAQGQLEMLEIILTSKKLTAKEAHKAISITVQNCFAHCLHLLIRHNYTLENGVALAEISKIGEAKNWGLTKKLVYGDLSSYDSFVSSFSFALQTSQNEQMVELLHTYPYTNEIFQIASYWGTPLQHIFNLKKEVIFLDLVKKELDKPSLDWTIQDKEGNTLLHLLARAGMPPPDLQEMDFAVRNNEGATPIHMAAVCANATVLKKYLEATHEKKIINLGDTHGKSAIFYAIEGRKVENLELFIEWGADVNHYDQHLITPLACGIAIGNLSIVKVLLKGGADPNKSISSKQSTPLHQSFQLDTNEIALTLLQNGANPQFPSIDGVQPIHAAAAFGKVAILQLLAAKGVSLSVQLNEGEQPIHVAISSGKKETVEAILEQRPELVREPIKLRQKKKDGETSQELGLSPLHMASTLGDSGMIQYLIAQKADVSAVTQSGETALVYTSAKGSPSTLSLFFPYKITENTDQLQQALINAIAEDNIDNMILLFNKGVSLHSDFQRNHALHIASRNGSLSCTQWLLQQGLDPSQPSSIGLDTFELSAANNNHHQFQLLLEFAKPNLDEQRSNGETLLHIAAKNGNLNHVLVLLNMEASLDVQNDQGYTPLHHVIEKGHPEIMKILLICGANQNLKTIMGLLPIAMQDTFDNHHPIRKAWQETQKVISSSKKGETRLHLAIRCANPLAVRLLSSFENINKLNSEGQTALDLAQELGQSEAMFYLHRQGGIFGTANK